MQSLRISKEILSGGSVRVMEVIQFLGLAGAGAGAAMALLSLTDHAAGRRLTSVLWGAGLAMLITGFARSDAPLSFAALLGATLGVVGRMASHGRSSVDVAEQER